METATHQHDRWAARRSAHSSLLDRQRRAYKSKILRLENELKQAHKSRQEAQDKLDEFLGLVMSVGGEKDTEAPETDMIKVLTANGYVVMEPDSGTFLSRRGRSLITENDELREKLRAAERENAILSGMGEEVDGC